MSNGDKIYNDLVDTIFQADSITVKMNIKTEEYAKHLIKDFYNDELEEYNYLSIGWDQTVISKEEAMIMQKAIDVGLWDVAASLLQQESNDG